MIQQKAVVMDNRQVGPACYRMALACSQGYAAAYPGQFVMVQVGRHETPLLRRPFSIFGLLGPADRPSGIELLYKVVGRGTEKLSRLRVDQQVDVIGPLGRGFQVDMNHKSVYLAAGGIGVAPIRFLATDLMARGLNAGRCRVFLGGQNKAELLSQEEFMDLGLTVTVTTDDGSAGDQCLVTDPLESVIKTTRPDMIYACGPPGMLQCIAGMVEKHHVPCQMSIETMMACGVGACLGCAVKRRKDGSTYLHACMDGPVFDAAEINLNYQLHA